MDVSTPRYGRSCGPSFLNFATNLGKSQLIYDGEMRWLKINLCLRCSPFTFFDMDLQTILIVPGSMGKCFQRVGTTALLITAGSQALLRSLLVAQSVKERHLDDFYERVLPNRSDRWREICCSSCSCCCWLQDDGIIVILWWGSKVRPEIWLMLAANCVVRELEGYWAIVVLVLPINQTSTCEWLIRNISCARYRTCLFSIADQPNKYVQYRTHDIARLIRNIVQYRKGSEQNDPTETSFSMKLHD